MEALLPTTVFCHLSKPGGGGDVSLRCVTASSGKVAARSASSSLLLAVDGPAAPALTKRRERRERRRRERKCLWNELRSDTRPLEFGAFKQPSSSSSSCASSPSLHALLLSSLYTGSSCRAAAFKPGASVTARSRASSGACGRALKLEGGKWSQAADAGRTEPGRRFSLILSPIPLF